jgi:hypothetical protein
MKDIRRITRRKIRAIKRSIRKKDTYIKEAEVGLIKKIVIIGTPINTNLKNIQTVRIDHQILKGVLSKLSEFNTLIHRMEIEKGNELIKSKQDDSK